MTELTTDTRPAGIGGIDLGGIDIAAAIFKATGGLYGSPGGSLTPVDGDPIRLPDWNTNGGDGALSDHFDFSQLPADRDALIKLLAEPEGTNPLFDLFKGDDAPHFANGGPEGTGIIVLLAAAAVVGAILWAADDLSDGAVCDFLGWEHDGMTDPDAAIGKLPSPAEMMADLLAKSGMAGIDPTSVGITDILGKLSDNAGKVTDLVGALQGAAQSGDSKMFAGALADLMALAGIDSAPAGLDTPAPQMLLDGIFEAFGVAGGLDGAGYVETVHDISHVSAVADWIATLLTSSDDFVI